MPDNAPAPDGKPKPTSPSSSGAGPGRSSLPPAGLKFKKNTAGKVVVMLSSVAKAPPPRTTQAITGTPAPVPIPVKTNIESPPIIKPLTPSLPEAHVELRKVVPKPPPSKRTAPIKINILPPGPAAAEEESIFAKDPSPPTLTPAKDSIFEIDDTPPVTEEAVPVGWKALEPGELLAFTDDLQTLDVFSHAQAKKEESPTRDPVPPVAPSPLPTAKSTALLPASPEKLVIEAKAPVTPPPLLRPAPMVHLPPVTLEKPVTVIQPPVVLVTPVPVAIKPALRPPPLPPPTPIGATVPPLIPVALTEAREPSPALHVAPPMVMKSGVTPEAKLHQPHLPGKDDQDKEETTPIVVTKSPPLSEPATARSTPEPPKTEPLPKKTELLPRIDRAPGRKLPPPLPPRSPVKDSSAVTGPILAKEAKPAIEPEKPSSAVTGPILTKETKLAPVPEKARRPVTLPARKVKLANLAPPVAQARDEASALIVNDPAGTKETKPVPGPQSIPPVAPEKKTEPVEAKTTPLETKPATPPISPAGPNPGKETKPALRPPALPSKLIREQELKKTAQGSESVAPPVENVVVAKSSPTDPPPKSPEPEKLKPPVEVPDKPSAAVIPVPPVSRPPAPANDKSAAPKKHRLPVKINRPRPPETPAVSAPVAVAAGVAMAAASAVGLKQPPVETLAAPPAPVEAKKKEPAAPVTPPSRVKPPLATTRAARLKRKRLIGTILFYILCALFPFALWYGGSYFSHETRVEGQIIPPAGMLLGDEAWIVGDFHDMISTVTEDLAADRTPKLLDIQERLNHVQRAQSDIAAREERIRLLQGQIVALKDDMNLIVKQAHDAAQAVWSGPGSDIDDEYDARQEQLGKLIADRAKSLGLDYQPDPNFNSPEVWANAYRLALYQVPKNVDSVKEHAWVEDQIKQWRAYTKSLDDRKQALRDQAAAIRLGPAAKMADLQAKIDDIQHRIDGTVSEEAPIKTELQQAQDDLNQSQTEEAGLDGKYYKELYDLPASSITKRLPIDPNGRFSWRNVEKDSAFAEGEHVHNYWLFARAFRPDGIQYWALYHITVGKDSTLELVVEPSAFASTKSMLRPDLSPDEQQQ